MLKPIHLILVFIFLTLVGEGQEWMLKLKSRVELRNWKLTSKADKTEKSLQGANISLNKGSTIISQTTSNSDGDFEIDVPAKGDFILTITYPGCNTKKFFVSTTGVPDEVGKDNYKPTVSIGGFVMSRPIKGVDYIGLNEPLVKVEYKAGGQNFDKDEAVTGKGIEIVSKIYDAETRVIEKFCATNKLGDDALTKLKNCPLAKSYYDKARNMLPDEQYPVEQLAKAEQCIKAKEVAEDAIALENSKKAAAANAANEKTIAQKAQKEKELFNKDVKKSTDTKPKTQSITPVTESKKTDNPQRSDNTENEDKSNSKYKKPAVIGANKYKENITKADEYFKTKRYTEAKSAYEEALKCKASDLHAVKRLAEIEKLNPPK